MSSSSTARTEFIWHPLRGMLLAGGGDFIVNASFRTFDPTYDTSVTGKPRFRKLADARVSLIIHDPTPSAAPSPDVVIECVTTQYGELHDKTTNDHPKLAVDTHMGKEIHFEVLGPAGLATDLKTLSYNDDPNLKFPVAIWSTRGLAEHDGASGTTRIGGRGNMGLKRYFTVGCYVDVDLRYTRGNSEKGIYPENMVIKVVVGDPPLRTEALPLRSGGHLRANIFDAPAGTPVKFEGYFDAEAIPTDNITPIMGSGKGAAGLGSVKIRPNNTSPPADVASVTGEKLGLPAIKKVAATALHTAQAAISIPDTIIKIPKPRRPFDENKPNIVKAYKDLSADERHCLLYNWFIEFVANRNLYNRAMKYFILKSNFVWKGMLQLELNVDDAVGGAFTSGQKITYKLDDILKPRDDVSFHEMTHAIAFDPQYLGNIGAEIYFPCQGTSHYLASYSNEFFAFQEGLPQFFASLFMDPDTAYLVELPPPVPPGPPPPRWPKLFRLTLPEAGNINAIKFGYDATMDIAPDKLEAGAGLAVEGCFSAALTSLWNYIWDKRPTDLITQKPSRAWVQDVDGSGRLPVGYLSDNINYWLFKDDTQQRFAELILNPLRSAIDAPAKLLGRISTRRYIDQIEIRTSDPTIWSLGKWPLIKQHFDKFKAINEFYISMITPQGGAATDVVRWSKDQIWYHFPDGATPAKLSNNASTTFLLDGIRIPAPLSVELYHGATLLHTVAATVSSQYSASVTFPALGLANPPPASTTPFDLLFKATNLNSALLFKGVGIV